MFSPRRSSHLPALVAAMVIVIAACGGASGPDESASPERGVGEPAISSTGPDADSEQTDIEPAATTTAPIESSESTTQPPATDSGDPTTTITTVLVEDAPSEFDAALDELIEFVEDERGHSFAQRPVVLALDNPTFSEAFAHLVAEDARESQTAYVNFTDIYRAMGVIGPTDDLESIWTSFGDAGVLGFYEPATGNIVLRGDELNALTRTTLVHELVHALDDQIFGLDRPEYDERDDEIGWAYSALFEGNAMVIERSYRSTMSRADRDEEILLQLDLPGGLTFSAFTNSFLDLQFGRYTSGERFASALWADGQATLDAAFVDPPSTSELLLEPDAYLDGQEPDPDVPAPPADGAVFEEGLWGRAGWEAVLGDVISSTDSQRAAEGWGGDRFVAWRDGDRACVRIDVYGDTPTDLDEFADAVESWAREGDRQVFYPTAEIVRVTACG
ncbi:MAG: hypothetical protein ACR2P0_15720 [Acidimicrobiales bacterium]